MLNEFINQEFQRIILDNTSFWLNMLDTNADVILWNKAAENISGYMAEEIVGKHDIWELLYPNKEYRNFIYMKALEIINNGDEITDFETTIVSKDGNKHTLSWNTHNVKNSHEIIIGSIAIARDVTQIKEHELELESLTLELKLSNEKLHELSYIDPLTKIHNRRSYEEKLHHELHSSKRSHKELSLLMIDIDCFKQYNDTYGHQKGDIVLFTVADTIKRTLRRKTDFLARYGGEEIVVVLPYTLLAQAKIISETILTNIIDLNIEHITSPHNALLTVSIGIASTQSGFKNLVYHADKALYKAKEKGRNRYEEYIDIPIVT